MVIENRAGAGGNIGAQAAAAAEPDGYTLLVGTAAMFGVNPLLYANSGVDLVRDFAVLGTINDMANVLSVNPKRLDVSSVAELVARGKSGGLIFGSVGNGSSSHLCATLLLQLGGFEATHVPYRGSSPAVAALLAGEFDFLFDTTATSTQQIRAGTFRALGVSTAKRASALPEVPTMQEAGLAGYAVSVWNTLLVHRRTPEAVAARLRQAFAEAMDEATQARLRASFVDPLLVPPPICHAGWKRSGPLGSGCRVPPSFRWTDGRECRHRRAAGRRQCRLGEGRAGAAARSGAETGDPPDRPLHPRPGAARAL
ncbi:Bug family tripartite tricarboxylate transporter substrate binding protein [Siccirubricoccus deserti]